MRHENTLSHKPTPICPKCGSASVRGYDPPPEQSRIKTFWGCQRPGCGFIGKRSEFTKRALDPRHVQGGDGNKHWRDPIALGMDGYGGE